MPSVLLIEDDHTIATALVRLLYGAGAGTVEWAAMPALVDDQRDYDIVVSDYDFGPDQPDGVETLQRLHRLHPTATFVLMSGLPREAPTWAKFLPKTEASQLADLVTNWG